MTQLQPARRAPLQPAVLPRKGASGLAELCRHCLRVMSSLPRRVSRAKAQIREFRWQRAHYDRTARTLAFVVPTARQGMHHTPGRWPLLYIKQQHRCTMHPGLGCFLHCGPRAFLFFPSGRPTQPCCHDSDGCRCHQCPRYGGMITAW